MKYYILFPKRYGDCLFLSRDRDERYIKSWELVYKVINIDKSLYKFLVDTNEFPNHCNLEEDVHLMVKL